jgi:Tfp pilus assembly protein PilE
MIWGSTILPPIATVVRTRRVILRRTSGVTLVELVAFIAIAGLMAAILSSSLGETLRDTDESQEFAAAVALAQERMELILGQRRKSGLVFSSFADPCPNATQACSTLTGYTVTSAIANNSSECTGTATADCRKITVTVTGPDGGQAAQLVNRVMNY